MMANTQKFEDYEPLCREENGTAIVQRISDGGLERWKIEKLLDLNYDIWLLPFSSAYNTSSEEQTEEVNVGMTASPSSGKETLEFSTTKTKLKWDHHSTIALIGICQEREKEEKITSNIKFWQGVMGTMHENGHPFTALQCKNKYDNLKNQYKIQKDKAGTSGEGNVKWEYYKIMQDFVGDRPEIQPVAVVDGAGRVVLKDTVTASEENVPSPAPGEFSVESPVDTESPCSSQQAFRHNKRRRVNSECSLPQNKIASKPTVAEAILQMNEDANKRHKERILRQDLALEKKSAALELLQKLIEKF
ncbi:uncharacterized protein LOC136039422 isoform X2 [Artemia franciscana]